MNGLKNIQLKLMQLGKLILDAWPSSKVHEHYHSII